MKAIALAVLLAVTCACQSEKGGVSSIRVKGMTKAEEDRVRLQEWRVERAMQEVIVRYDLEGLNIMVVIEEEGGLGETKPSVDLILEATGATVSINERLFLDDPPASDDVLLGLFAHELGHALHYSKMNQAELIVFAERYVRFFESPHGELRRWAAAYEQFTDLTAIAHGYADVLVAQKIASKDNVARHHPEKVWDFYLEPEDIAALGKDPALLRARIDETLQVVGFTSLRHFAETLPIEAAR